MDAAVACELGLGLGFEDGVFADGVLAAGGEVTLDALNDVVQWKAVGVRAPEQGGIRCEKGTDALCVCGRDVIDEGFGGVDHAFARGVDAPGEKAHGDAQGKDAQRNGVANSGLPGKSAGLPDQEGNAGQNHDGEHRVFQEKTFPEGRRRQRGGIGGKEAAEALAEGGEWWDGGGGVHVLAEVEEAGR